MTANTIVDEAISSYLARDLVALNMMLQNANQESENIASFVSCLKHHAEGRLDLAIKTDSGLTPADKHKLPPRAREFLWADINLARAKLGQKPDFSITQLRNHDANHVLQYAFFTWFFWVDHKAAFGSLYKMLVSSLMSARIDFLLMTVFLIAHLRTIANKKVFSWRTASNVYQLSCFLRKKKILMSPFALDIIASTFPYTCYVRAHFSAMKTALQASKPFVGKDPYYNLLYSITSLYHAAYSGNILETEKLVPIFKKLQDEGKLLRYRPVTALMGMLPFCIRGYQHVVRDQFKDFMSSYDRKSHDILINSQVFRIAAIINTSLGEFDLAAEHISLAVDYRCKAAFHSWTHIDDKITRVIREKKNLEDIFGTFGATNEDAKTQARSGWLITQLVDQLAKANGDMERLARATAEVIARHLTIEYAVVDQPIQIGIDQFVLEVFGKRVLFMPATPEEMQRVLRLVEAILPSVRSVEATAIRLRDTQEQLKQKEKYEAMATTTQMLAHDVKRPFVLVDTILRRLSRAPEHTVKDLCNEFLPEVARSLDSVNAMISDFMEISRKASGQDIRSKKVRSGRNSNFADVARKSIAHLTNAPVTITLDAPEKTLVGVDEFQLERVLSNLVENAVQAIGSAPLEQQALAKIWIKASLPSEKSPDGAHAMLDIEVGNTGSYIDSSDLPQIFEAFWTRNKASGTGLGLAIVQHYVVSNGGTLTCESSKEQGTIFKFCLPMETVPDDSSSVRVLPSRHLIVIDDCPFIRAHWTGLDSLKVPVKAFASADDFWNAIKSDPSILREAMSVVTDYWFDETPNYSGLNIAQDLRSSGWDGSLYLSSNAPLDEAETRPFNIVLLPKDPERAAERLMNLH
jgi:signal transduction histidine kinase